MQEGPPKLLRDFNAAMAEQVLTDSDEILSVPLKIGIALAKRQNMLLERLELAALRGRDRLRREGNVEAAKALDILAAEFFRLVKESR